LSLLGMYTVTMMPLSLVYKSLQMYLARMFQIELPGSEANH